mgnify:FL=1
MNYRSIGGYRTPHNTAISKPDHDFTNKGYSGLRVIQNSILVRPKTRAKKVFNSEAEFGMILNKHPKERGQSE